MSKPKINIVSRLILESDGKILLLAQTANNGGNFTLIGGKVEYNENPKEALKRESFEEAGIKLKKKHLNLFHVLYRMKANQVELVLLFNARKWSGVPVSREPKKFINVRWVSLDNLPANLPIAISHILDQYKKGEFYSEFAQ